MKTKARYRELVRAGERVGVRVVLVAIPTDYQHMRLKDLRSVGDPGDLGEAMACAAGYISGMTWRDRPTDS